jgi:hypothetical protein
MYLVLCFIDVVSSCYTTTQQGKNEVEVSMVKTLLKVLSIDLSGK